MPQLMQVASNYGASITHEDLATALQDKRVIAPACC